MSARGENTTKKIIISKSVESQCYNPRVFRKYPHLSFVVISYVGAILLFFALGADFFHELVKPFGMGGAFVAGMMYSFSFTTSLGALALPAFLDQYSVATIAILGGLGGTFADITILKFVRGNLKKEMKAIGATKLLKRIRKLPLMHWGWFRDALGFLVIISPLPDEIGVAIMASTRLSESTFRVICLIANILGIYLLVSAVSALY